MQLIAWASYVQVQSRPPPPPHLRHHRLLLHLHRPRHQYLAPLHPLQLSISIAGPNQ